MSARARPRGGKAGPLAYNLALLVGCVLPVSSAALLGVLWVQGSVADLHHAVGGLALIYMIAIIPVAVFGIVYLLVVMTMAEMHPVRGREIALSAMAACFLGLMVLGSPPDADTLAGWIGLATAMAAWALAIHLTPGTRATEDEWIVAIAPGVLLLAATHLFA